MIYLTSKISVIVTDVPFQGASDNIYAKLKSIVEANQAQENEFKVEDYIFRKLKYDASTFINISELINLDNSVISYLSAWTETNTKERDGFNEKRFSVLINGNLVSESSQFVMTNIKGLVGDFVIQGLNHQKDVQATICILVGINKENYKKNNEVTIHKCKPI